MVVSNAGSQVVFAVPINPPADVTCGSGAEQKSNGSCKCKDPSRYLDIADNPQKCYDKGDCPDGTKPNNDDKTCVTKQSDDSDSSNGPPCKLGDTPEACANSTADPAANGCGSGCDIVTKYLNPAINTLSGIVGILAVLSIILGAIQYITSEGDPQKAAKAKARITNTILGLIAFFFLYALLQFLIPGGILHP
jgi:hypothetical protein